MVACLYFSWNYAQAAVCIAALQTNCRWVLPSANRIFTPVNTPGLSALVYENLFE